MASGCPGCQSVTQKLLQVDSLIVTRVFRSDDRGSGDTEPREPADIANGSRCNQRNSDICFILPAVAHPAARGSAGL